MVSSATMRAILTSFLLLLLLLLSINSCRSQDTTTPSTDPSHYYTLCSSNSTCGNKSIPYPMAPQPFCHHPLITPSCSADGILHLASPQQTGTFRVLGNLISDSTGSITFYNAADSLFGCGQISAAKYSAGPTVFSLPSKYTYGTHLNCTRQPTGATGLQSASCLGCTDEGNVCYYSPGFVSFPECEQFFLFVPVGFNVSAEKDLRGYLQKGFSISYSNPVQCQSCQRSGGRCGADPSGSFVCFCPTSVHPANCSDGVFEDLAAWFPQDGKSGSSTTLIVALSTSLSVVTLLVAATFALLIFRRKRRSLNAGDSEMQEGKNTITKTGLNDLVEGISPTRYSYSQIKKFTNNFATKLGEGGFGHIYRGTIHKNKIDIPVAVKILKDTKQSEKQFMSEVATIGRIHHNNLVRMLGYCVQGKKRALIYEFMPNGSLDKFINVNKSRDSDESNGFECLSPRQMQNMALDIARGLQYLHEGCRSRILHCDIKPHNVLLDSSFSAKVSDFGLAKMMNKDISHISLTDARGTPGYAAPEMWSKSYGPITEKSDVYSYGMLILEMVKGREDHELGVANSSQDYLHEWAFKQVKNNSSCFSR